MFSKVKNIFRECPSATRHPLNRIKTAVNSVVDFLNGVIFRIMVAIMGIPAGFGFTAIGIGILVYVIHQWLGKSFGAKGGN